MLGGSAIVGAESAQASTGRSSLREDNLAAEMLAALHDRSFAARWGADAIKRGSMLGTVAKKVAMIFGATVCRVIAPAPAVALASASN